MKTLAFIFYFLLSAVNLGYQADIQTVVEEETTTLSMSELIDHGFVLINVLGKTVDKKSLSDKDYNPLDLIDVQSPLSLKSLVISRGILSSENTIPLISGTFLKFTHFLRYPIPA